jgi:hypothetical protein
MESTLGETPQIARGRQRKAKSKNPRGHTIATIGTCSARQPIARGVRKIAEGTEEACEAAGGRNSGRQTETPACGAFKPASNPSDKGPGKLAGATGLEPATSGVTGRHSNQLSYAPAGDMHALLAARRQELSERPSQVKDLSDVDLSKSSAGAKRPGGR